MPERSGAPLGIFGGTFDPVHFGHLRLAEEALDALRLTAVRWIPAGHPALRDSPQASASQRLAMVRLALAGNPRFQLDTAEVETDRTSFTVPTLERLRQPDACGPQQPLVLLVGADAFAGMPFWHRWECLFDLAHIAVVCRPGYTLESKGLPAALAETFRQRFSDSASALTAAPAGCIVSFPMTPLNISATKIRALLSKGESPRYLLPDTVIDHIRTHHLYQET